MLTRILLSEQSPEESKSILLSILLLGASWCGIPLLAFSLSRAPAQRASQPDSIEDSTECNMRPIMFSGVPASRFALPPSLSPLATSPQLPHAATHFPLAWGAGGEGAGSGARPGATAEGQTPFGDLLAPSQGSEAENTTRAQPTLSSSTRRISCAVRMSARRKLDTIFRIKASGYSLSLPWFVDAPRYLHGAAQDAQLLLLAFVAQMLHQGTQREVRARVITEHQCRCGELGRGSWPHLWSPPTPLLVCGVALADQPL